MRGPANLTQPQCLIGSNASTQLLTLSAFLWALGIGRTWLAPALQLVGDPLKLHRSKANWSWLCCRTTSKAAATTRERKRTLGERRGGRDGIAAILVGYNRAERGWLPTGSPQRVARGSSDDAMGGEGLQNRCHGQLRSCSRRESGPNRAPPRTRRNRAGLAGHEPESGLAGGRLVPELVVVIKHVQHSA